MKWITRERPKIDRIACAWLIKRFVDNEAESIYVPFEQVLKKSQNWMQYPSTYPRLNTRTMAMNAPLTTS